MMSSDFEKEILTRFEAYSRENNKGINDVDMARGFVRDYIRDFEVQERTYGTGKTRRPNFNHLYFEDAFRRVVEVKRRRDEDLNRWFGED